MMVMMAVGQRSHRAFYRTQPLCECQCNFGDEMADVEQRLRRLFVATETVARGVSAC